MARNDGTIEREQAQLSAQASVTTTRKVKELEQVIKQQARLIEELQARLNSLEAKE